MDCLHLLINVVGNESYKKSLHKIAAEVEKGIPLSTQLSKEEVFPSIVSQMIKVGEQSGKMDEILDKLGDHYEEDIDNRTQKIGDLIEPVIIVILGLAVSILFAGVLMPIYQIAQMQ